MSELHSVKEKAWAKLNLSLDVGKRREDGYHDMVMVMQTVSLRDDIEMIPVEGRSVRAFCDLPYVPGDERNLAVKAAKLYLASVGAAEQGLRIDIKKIFPWVRAWQAVPPMPRLC